MQLFRLLAVCAAMAVVCAATLSLLLSVMTSRKDETEGAGYCSLRTFPQDSSGGALVDRPAEVGPGAGFSA